MSLRSVNETLDVKSNKNTRIELKNSVVINRNHESLHHTAISVIRQSCNLHKKCLVSCIHPCPVFCFQVKKTSVGGGYSVSPQSFEELI